MMIGILPLLKKPIPSSVNSYVFRSSGAFIRWCHIPSESIECQRWSVVGLH